MKLELELKFEQTWIDRIAVIICIEPLPTQIFKPNQASQQINSEQKQISRAEKGGRGRARELIIFIHFIFLHFISFQFLYFICTIFV